MNITLNGNSIEIESNQTVEQMVRARGLDPEKIAIELNRRLLKSEKYSTELKDGDEVEIVTFVGGG